MVFPPINTFLITLICNRIGPNHLNQIIGASVFVRVFLFLFLRMSEVCRKRQGAIKANVKRQQQSIVA